ncbi:MAG: glycosyltransferase family 2 protein [Pedobacter sp.]
MNKHSHSPVVTIAIPNYNTATYIGEAIESALSQTYRDIEILVIDNASTDNSRCIIDAWKIRDDRIIALNFDKHVSSLENWNRCLEHARGQYIVFLHADDRLKPAFLETALEVFAHRPDLGYVLAEKEYIDGQGNVSGKSQFYADSAIIPGLSEARVNFVGWHTVAVQMLIRTECMKAIGGYSYTDVMAVLQLNMRWDVGYLHTPLVQYRQHEQSDTSQFIKDKTMLMTIYLTKMLVLNYHLPQEGFHLKDLKPQVMQWAAQTCLKLYAMDVLGRNEKRLCEEYLALARGFWLEVDQTPMYKFLERAIPAPSWTPQTLRETWMANQPETPASGPPYPLPEGSVPFSLALASTIS